jgi:hypothetical protein
MWLFTRRMAISSDTHWSNSLKLCTKPNGSASAREEQPMAGREFAMMDTDGGKRVTIPMYLAEAIHKLYAECGHDQALDRIEERGGFTFSEIEAYARLRFRRKQREATDGK